MKLIIIPGALLVLIFSAQTTFACSCDGWSLRIKTELLKGRRTELDARWVAEFSGVVFVGTVVKKQKVTFHTANELRTSKITFKVERSWTGVTSPEIDIYSWVPGNGSCGFPFKKGKSYIVFAEIIENRLYATICGFTAEGRYAPNMIKALGLDQANTLIAIDQPMHAPLTEMLFDGRVCQLGPRNYGEKKYQ